jgi:dihydroflavonol-4-reductase
MKTSTQKSRAAAESAPSAPDASPRTALVTGVTGFVGRHVARTLKAAGWRVRALVRDPARLAPVADWVDEHRVGDLLDPASLRGVCDDVDAVVHCACAVAGTFDAGRSAEELFLQVNRDGTVNLAREVLRHPGLRLVHVSSTAAMGAPEQSVVDERTECRPTTPYQRSKRAAELALLELHENDGLDVVIVRPCVVAGEGKEKSELLTLFRLVKRGVFPLVGGNLDLHKPLIDVDDLADALVLATERGRAGGIYLVHSDGNHTIGEILRAARDLVGRRFGGWIPIPLAPAHLAARVFEAVQRVAPDWNPPVTRRRLDLFVTDRRIDISLARAELGFQPRRQSARAMLERSWRDFHDRGLV